MVKCFALPFALTAACLSAPAYADDTAELALYSEFRTMDARVAEASYRLATRNARYCEQQLPATGFMLSDVTLYPENSRDNVGRAYSVGGLQDDGFFISAVAPDSPAWLAGLRVGHRVIQIDSAPLSQQTDGSGSMYHRMAGIDFAMPGWLSDGQVDVGILTGDTVVNVPVEAVPACASIFQVTASDDLEGAADGRYVQVSAALVAFAAQNDDLAAVLAHEMAHNILRHRERLDAAGVKRNLLVQMGRSANLIRQTETEADRLSVWLLAGAGYDPEAAIRFWTRRSEEGGSPLIASATHGRRTTRIAIIAEEIAAMRAAEAADPDIRPALLDMAPLE